VGSCQLNFSNLYSGYITWGGWGSNSRPADYENYGPTLRARWLHGYYGAVPPMTLSALVAQMARSTNRSTAAGPDPLILLLCVTSLAAPGLCQEPGPSPEDNRGVLGAPTPSARPG
jgi:hypothetical protein